MRASVVIATKDRKEELHRAISSAIRQTESVEIVVVDDGSVDGTSEMVRSEFPQVGLDRTPISLGQAARRNEELPFHQVRLYFEPTTMLNSRHRVSSNKHWPDFRTRAWRRSQFPTLSHTNRWNSFNRAKRGTRFLHSGTQ
jgi:hypothetical protein